MTTMQRDNWLEAQEALLDQVAAKGRELGGGTFAVLSDAAERIDPPGDDLTPGQWIDCVRRLDACAYRHETVLVVNESGELWAVASVERDEYAGDDPEPARYWYGEPQNI